MKVLLRWKRRRSEAFYAGAMLVWIVSLLNSLHMLVYDTKRKWTLNFILALCILVQYCSRDRPNIT